MNLNGQEAFDINWNNETVYWGAGLAANGVGYLLFENTDDIKYEDWVELDIQNINAIDRPAVFNNSVQADFYSDVVGNGSAALPLIIYALKIKDPKWRASSIMYFELAMMNFAVNNITKYGFRRPRPYVYSTDFQIDQTINKAGRASFVSGHTSFASSNSFFAAALFHRAYPNSPLVPYVYITASAVPIITGIYRVEAGKHFYSDVIAGMITGACVATLVIQIHKRDDLRLQSSLNGVGLVMTF